MYVHVHVASQTSCNATVYVYTFTCTFVYSKAVLPMERHTCIPACSVLHVFTYTYVHVVMVSVNGELRGSFNSLPTNDALSIKP